MLVPDGEGHAPRQPKPDQPGDSLGARVGLALMTPGSWVMERTMLTGIKERAERLAGESRSPAA